MKNIKNFFGYSLSGIAVLILNILIIPIQTRIISVEDYGNISYFFTIANLIFNVSLFGLDRGYVRYFNEFNNNKKKFIKKIMAIPLISVVIISLLTYIKFKNRLDIIYLGIHSLTLIILRFYILFLRMEEKIKEYITVETFRTILFLIIPTIFYYINKQISSYYFGVVLLDLILILFGIKYIFLEKEDTLNDRLNINMSEILRYSIPLMMVGILSWSMASLDRIFLKKYTNLMELGYYSVAFKIISILEVIKGAFINFWNPLVYKEDQNLKEIKELYAQILRIVIFISFLSGFLMLIFSEGIIIVLGEKYRNTLDIFYPLTLIPIMGIISEITYIGINLEKKSYYNLYISAIILIYNLIGNYIVIKIWQSKGVAIVTGTTYILYFILRTVIGYKFYKIYFKKIKFIILLILYSFNSLFSFLTREKKEILYISFFVFLFLEKKEMREIYSELKKLINIKRMSKR